MKNIAAEAIPKVNEIDEAIYILEEMAKVIKLKIAELKSKRKAYYGKVVPVPDLRSKKARKMALNTSQDKITEAFYKRHSTGGN